VEALRDVFGSFVWVVILFSSNGGVGKLKRKKEKELEKCNNMKGN